MAEKCTHTVYCIREGVLLLRRNCEAGNPLGSLSVWEEIPARGPSRELPVCRVEICAPRGRVVGIPDMSPWRPSCNVIARSPPEVSLAMSNYGDEAIASISGISKRQQNRLQVSAYMCLDNNHAVS